MKLDQLIKLSERNCLVKSICILISFIYSLIVHLRIFLYKLKILKAIRSKFLIISVGNLSLGGTGKTPFVIALAKYFQRDSSISNKNIYIVSRGYKSRRKKLEETKEIKSNSNPETYGDEAVLIKNSLEEYQKIKVFTNINKKKALKFLEQEFFLENKQKEKQVNKNNLVILDDGFQYLGLERDLNICLIDCSDLYFNRVFPLGTARESLKQIKRADLFCLTRVSPQSQANKEKIYQLLRKYHKDAPTYEIKEKISIYRTSLINNRLQITESINSEDLKEQRLGAFCGLGNSKQFFEALEYELGLKRNLKKFIDFPDHHSYKSLDLQKISLIQADLSLNYLITTEKDFIKIKELRFSLKSLLVAKLELIIPEKLANLLRSFD